MMYVRICGCKPSQCISDSPFRGKCTDCKQFYKSIDVEKSNNPEALINAAESELESANFHSITSLPSTLFKRISKLVPESLHFQLAQAIRSAMP